MNMKKLVLFTAIVIVALTLMGGLALAGGWTTVDYTTSHDPNDTSPADGTAIWNPNEVSPRSPHGSFSSSTNKCRVCHAVHMANSDSWRLLGISDPTQECDVCHGDTGLTLARPYGAKTYTPKGAHTIGATVIPDATGTTLISGGLTCNNCHSVHGANTLIGVGAASGWDAKILKRDANTDGNVLAAGSSGVVGTGDASANEKKTNFCADCHNRNPNWDTSDGVWPQNRANKSSHVQGPAADGTLEVNGTTTTVAGWGNSETSGTADAGCRDCHAGSDGGNVWGVGDTSTSASAFPHETIGSKLMFDSYDGDLNGSAADPNRVLEDMDALCGKCHTDTGTFGAPTTPTAGVGVTF